MSKYAILIELINEWLEGEKKNLQEAISSAGSNCAGACMAMGAIEAYQQILSDIEDLEQEAVLSDL